MAWSNSSSGIRKVYNNLLFGAEIKKYRSNEK